MQLAQKKCEACEGGIGPLPAAEIAKYLADVKGWVQRGELIEKKWKFNNYADAQTFVVKIGAIAEDEGHHPDMHFGWGYVTVELTTHAAKGITLNDFIVAAKIDAIG
jgi:4a-hydroxytetrahydrobiopterin dehydratase